jgi:aminoglycoside 6-adenylyltransferase
MDHLVMVDRVVQWAETDENIREVVLTGSVARGDHDLLSDLDIELYAREPSELLDRRDWYDAFGDLLAVEELPNPEWIPTRLLYLVDGKIDFAIGDLRSFGAVPYVRRFRVLVDKDNRRDELIQAGDASSPTAPTETQYTQCLNWFSAAALMEAKMIVRLEPWLAKLRDQDLKAQLLRMIEWDHRCRHGWDTDVWYGGKHIRQWADADVRAHLEACWAGFEPEEAIAGLRASMQMFERLAERTGSALGFPAFHHDRVQQEADRIIASA